jgi:hypothetical protein
MLNYVVASLFDWMSASGRLVTEFVLVAPLKMLYLKGPNFSGFGFWEGKDPAGICSQLSNVPASFWVSNKQECEGMIERKLESIVVLVLMSVYMGTVSAFVLYFGAWLFVVRPLRNELRRIISRKKK